MDERYVTFKHGVSVVTAARKKLTPKIKAAEQKEVARITKEVKTHALTNADLIKYARKEQQFTHMSDTEIKTKFGEKALDIIPPGYFLSKRLGKGVSGTTYQICHDRFHCLAVKFQLMTEPRTVYEQEVNMQELFASYNLAPKVLSPSECISFINEHKSHKSHKSHKKTSRKKSRTKSHSRKKSHTRSKKNILFFSKNKKNEPVCSILMERIDGTLKGLLASPNLSLESLKQITGELFVLIGKMKEHNLTHGDFHHDNIAYRWTSDSEGVLHYELMVIDFGWSKAGVAHTELDVMQLVRTLLYFQENKVSTEYGKIIAAPFKDLLKNTYGIHDFSEDGIEERYFAMRRRLIRSYPS